jgi:hypothetical protein
MGAFEETLDAGGVLIQSGGIAGDYCAFTIQVSSTAPDYECVQDTDCAQGSKCVDSDLNVVGVQGVCVDAPLTCEENCEAVKIICYADEYMTTTACNNDYSACVDACVAVETPPAGGDIAVGPGGIGPGDIILPEGQQVGTDTIVPALNVPTYDCTGFDEFTGPQGDLIKISKPTVQCKQGLETCENGVCVAVVTPEPVVDVLKGDVNNDGSISIIDALKTKQYFLGQITEFTDSSGIYINGVSAADVNCDGSVTIIDALKIKQKFLGQIESFTDSTGGVCQ